MQKSVTVAFPLALTFLAKGQLAIEILKKAYADGLFSDFICGDESLDPRQGADRS